MYKGKIQNKNIRTLITCRVHKNIVILKRKIYVAVLFLFLLMMIFDWVISHQAESNGLISAKISRFELINLISVLVKIYPICLTLINSSKYC